jgi:hypothetical protein
MHSTVKSVLRGQVVASKSAGVQPAIARFDALHRQKYADVYDQRAIAD